MMHILNITMAFSEIQTKISTYLEKSEFIQCACRFTENIGKEDEHLSKRYEAKMLIKELKKDNPEIEDNMFRALHRVQLNTFPGYQKGKEVHNILDDYDKKEKK